jgi:hypothetical protein
MKLVIVLMIATGLQVTAKSSDAQNVTLSGKHMPLGKIFREIREQTGYQFFYKDEFLKDAKPLDIDVRDIPVKEAIVRSFIGQPLTYAMVGNTIVVRPRGKSLKNSAKNM